MPAKQENTMPVRGSGPQLSRAISPCTTESDADEAVGIDGQPEDEGDDPDDDELAQEELADEARAERAGEGLGEAEAMEEDA